VAQPDEGSRPGPAYSPGAAWPLRGHSTRHTHGGTTDGGGSGDKEGNGIRCKHEGERHLHQAMLERKGLAEWQCQRWGGGAWQHGGVPQC
jgi:hypothetical protein